MTILSELKSKGWHLSEEGLDLCSGNMDNPTVSSIIKKALDMDIREIGGNFFPEDLTRGKLDSISGAGVVQIQKVKNATAPKYEYGSGAPPILRLLLTDGNTYVNCLQWGQWKSLSLETPPGTKLYLKPGKITMQSNFLLLNEYQFTKLGGCVTAMVEKWELCKKLASHIRAKENLDGSGPPPWIPFGQPIIGVKPSKSGANFRSLESENKDAKEDAVFKQQRQANIAEVARVKETKVKSFGGRKDKPFPSKQDYGNTSYVQPNEYVGYENDTRKAADFAQDSPVKNRTYPNDKNRKNTRNEYSQPRQDSGRSYNSNNNVTNFQSSSKDNKPENRNKLGAYSLGDFITPDVKQHSAFQVKTSESEPSLSNSSRQYKQINKDYRPSSDRRSQKSDSRSLVNMMEQVQIFGYDAQDVSTHPFLKPGTEVLAKYWEDNQFYRAVITAVGKEGKTCVVRFLDYGNHEEVLISDVKEKSSSKEKNWNAGAVFFPPPSRNNYENYSTFHNQNYRDISKSHQNTNRPYGRQDMSRGSRTEYRPSAKIYQPPSQRDSYS